jgi:prepilin-type N-terminal cleavage/methylation domain-containing protein
VSRRSRRRRIASRAFTLVEVMATVVVLAIMGSITSAIISTASDGYLDASIRAQIHEEMTAALALAAREIRAIPLDTDATGVAPDIDVFDNDVITWQPTSLLQYTGGNLTLRRNGGPIINLLQDVSAVTFNAYDESNTLLTPQLTLTACDPIRRIEINVTVTRNGVSETLRTRVFLRSTIDGVSG